MSQAPETPTPKSALDAINQACMEIPRNETSYQLERNQDALMRVLAKFKELGQYRLINLANSYEKSRVAHAFYAGNGFVIKVIPEYFLGRHNAIFHLPAISTDHVKLDHRNLVIKTYPWLDPGKVSPEDIKNMGEKLRKHGLTFENNEAWPRNIHILPNSEKTLVGIDSSMYVNTENGGIDPLIEKSWHEYIHRLFPIYKQEKIPHQTEDTDFSFFSIHDKEAENFVFENGFETEAKKEKPEPEEPRPFFSFLGLG